MRVGTSNDAVREEWIRSRLRDLPAGFRILDAGAGQQRFRPYCSHLTYVSQDFGEYKPQEQCGPGLQMESWNYGKLDIVSDITSIPAPDRSFDAILCSEVFEHIPDPVAALREFARLLRPGGTLLLTAPFASLTHFAPYHFYSGFSQFFYERVLPETGFRIEEITPNGNFFEFVAQELGRAIQIRAKYGVTREGAVSRFFTKVATRFVLQRMQTYADADRGSSEVLCYGFHVRAVRAGD